MDGSTVWFDNVYNDKWNEQLVENQYRSSLCGRKSFEFKRKRRRFERRLIIINKKYSNVIYL